MKSNFDESFSELIMFRSLNGRRPHSAGAGHTVTKKLMSLNLNSTKTGIKFIDNTYNKSIMNFFLLEKLKLGEYRGFAKLYYIILYYTILCYAMLCFVYIIAIPLRIISILHLSWQ